MFKMCVHGLKILKVPYFHCFMAYVKTWLVTAAVSVKVVDLRRIHRLRLVSDLPFDAKLIAS